MTDEPTERDSLGLLSLPYFILIDAIIPLVNAQDVARLRLVSRATKTIVDDELIWKRFIIEDFNFPSHASARVTGWQQLYRGLARPQLYTWGQSANCRLGVPPSELPEDVRILIMRHQGAPFPIPVDTRGVSAPPSSQSAVDKEEVSAVVEVVAGGWSFHALTRTGQILCWGQLDGDSFVDDGSPSSSGHRVQKPIVLKSSVDEPVKSISCGRRHGVALTSKQDVLEWHNWKVAARHNRLIDVGGEVGAASYKTVQLEAGWDFSVILMHDTQQASSRPTTSDTASSSTILYWHTEWVQTDAEDSGKVYDAPKIALPPLPEPSEEVGLELSDCDAAAHCHVIQVAGGEDYVVALTASGLVYKIVLPRFHMPHQSDPSSQHPSTRLSAACRNGTASWQLMEHFCLPSKIGRLPYFQNDGGERVQQLVHPGLRIKHISAQFRTWVAYTVASAGADGTASDEGGIVLLGKGDGVSETGPEVKHELQDAGVIKVSVGDWHCGALTASGKVMTWGQWSNGALGAWDSLPLLRPPQPSTQRSFQPQPEVDNPLPRTNPFTRFRIGLAGARLRSEQSNSVPPQPAPSVRPQPQPAETGSSSDPSAQAAPAAEADAQQLRLADRIIPFRGINAPTCVHFDAHKSDRSFVFDIAFAGWHSAALAIDSHLVGGASGSQSDNTQPPAQAEALNNSSPNKGHTSRRPLHQATQAGQQRHGEFLPSSFDLDTEIRQAYAAHQRAQQTHRLALAFLVLGLFAVLGGWEHLVVPTSTHASAGWDQDLAEGPIWLRGGLYSLPQLALLLIPLGLYFTIAQWVGWDIWRYS